MLTEVENFQDSLEAETSISARKIDGFTWLNIYVTVLNCCECVFGVQLFAAVLLFLLNINSSFRKQLCSQHCTGVLALPRTRAVGKAALGKDCPSGNHTWTCFMGAAWEKAEQSEHAFLQNIVGPLLSVPGWQEMNLTSVSFSFISLHHCQMHRPNSRRGYLPTSLQGLGNKLPIHAPPAPKPTETLEKIQ